MNAFNAAYDLARDSEKLPRLRKQVAELEASIAERAETLRIALIRHYHQTGDDMAFELDGTIFALDNDGKLLLRRAKSPFALNDPDPEPPTPPETDEATISITPTGEIVGEPSEPF